MHLTIRDRGAHETSISDGSCGVSELKEITFNSLLGVELLARLNEREKLELTQELFEILARAKNGDAATAATKTIYELMAPLDKRSPWDSNLSVEEYRARRRKQIEEFFDWLLSVYWELPLYEPKLWETSLSGSGMNYENPLKDFRDWSIKTVLNLWAREQDSLALRAFEFLCDHIDSARFFEKAPALKEKFMEKGKRLDYFSRPDLPKEDINSVLAEMRDSLAGENIAYVSHWLKIAQEQRAPKNACLLLGHAFVNAGGNVLGSPE